MEKLIIDPSTWIRREGGAHSFLLRKGDGKRCCLGIYLQDNCGVSPDVLRGLAAPEYIDASLRSLLPRWLVSHNKSTRLAEKMMSVNDDDGLTEDEVRAEIQQLFSQVDIDVEFTKED